MDAKELEAQYRGAKSYRLTKVWYSHGKLYQPGEVITVEDRKPGSGWVPVSAGEAKAARKGKAKEAAPAPAAAAATASTVISKVFSGSKKRAADQEI